MESLTTRSNVCMCAMLFVVLGLVVQLSAALPPPPDALQDSRWKSSTDDDVDTWQQLTYRDEIFRDMERLSNAENEILSKIKALTSEREHIRKQKRGHVQCFLNVVACYRKKR